MAVLVLIPLMVGHLLVPPPIDVPPLAANANKSNSESFSILKFEASVITAKSWSVFVALTTKDVAFIVKFGCPFIKKPNSS